MLISDIQDIWCTTPVRGSFYHTPVKDGCPQTESYCINAYNIYCSVFYVSSFTLKIQTERLERWLSG